MQQRYVLTMQNLFTNKDGVVSGCKAEVAILDGATEVDRVSLIGKVGPGNSVYRREYEGKAGLRAELLTGIGQITFEAT
jgi:hypothetical protein